MILLMPNSIRCLWGVSLRGGKNDLDGGATFWPMWFTSGRMIGVVPTDELEENYIDSKTEVLYDNFRKYDNPVLQIAYF